MTDELKIEYEWLDRPEGDLEAGRACEAVIGIRLGDEYLTRLDDSWGQTVRNQMRVSAHTLATWFASNWWRLRWEPETPGSRRDVDWRMSHCMAAAGAGYVWPNVIFASDGDSLAVASRPGRKAVAFEPVRYLNRIDGRISAEEFERSVDQFLEGVLSRLYSMNVPGDDLLELWTEVMRERQDPKLTQWRKLEALCGYDPDEAPAAIIELLRDDNAGLGGEALEEVAAVGRHATAKLLKPILSLAKAVAAPRAGGFRGSMPTLTNKPRIAAGERPWQAATKLAQFARKEWGLENKPIKDKVLAGLLGLKSAVFAERAKSTALPLALRAGTSDSFDIYFNSSWATSRRFACSRLIGDHLYFRNQGRLIPATDAKTSRQQFQRAFAQELLCPFDALLEKIQTEQPNEEDISEAAAYFEVSPLMVETTLVNKGELDREVLSWRD